MSRKELYLLLALAAVQFTHIIDFMVMMPLSPQLTEAFQISVRQFNWLVSAYGISAAIAGLVVFLFIDRLDREAALFWLYAGFALGTLACAIAPDYYSLMAARTVAGAFGGVTGALVLTIAGDAVALEFRGRAMGIVMLSFSAASVFGVPAGLKLAHHIGWHAPFVAVAALGVILLAAITALVPSMRAHIDESQRAHPWLRLRSLLEQPGVAQALVFTFFLMLGHFTIIPMIAQYMEKNVGVANEDLFWIYFVGGAATFISAPTVGHLSDRFGKRRVFSLFLLLSLIPIFWISNMRPSPLWAALSATTLFFITANGRFIPAMALVTSTVPARIRGGFMSINSAVQQIGMGAAAALGGALISDHQGVIEHFDRAGATAAALCVIALLLSRMLHIHGAPAASSPQAAAEAA
ncbi:MAG: MFS transporter [Leptospirales bacterium]|nr:MFS transporter [Leptospirales bacterium]